MIKNYFTLSLFTLLFFGISSYAQTTALPDPNFEQALIDLGIDSDGTVNGEVLTSDISSVTSLNVNYKNINDLTGIEDFLSLSELNCGSNSIASLDLTQNTSLEYLSCYSNQLTSIDVSQNTALEYLYCYSNQLTSLDLTQNTALTELNSEGNQLINLDVSQNTALTELFCRTNQLTSLDIGQNTALIEIDCPYNQLTSIDVSQNTVLERLAFHNNQITSIDVSQNTSLNYLICSNNQLQYLNIQNGNNNNTWDFDALENPFLICIQVDNVDAANAGNFPYSLWNKDDIVLYSEECSEKMIPDPNFEQALIDLGLDTDGIINGSINPDDVKDVTTLDVQNYNISDLTGISFFTSLEQLDCSNNQILELNVTNNKKIELLNCNNNNLTKLDIPKDEEYVVGDWIIGATLSQLDCSNNELSSLDLSKNFNIGSLNCSFNKLESLILPKIFYLGIGGQYKIPALSSLNCSNNQITTLKLKDNLGLNRIDCSYNIGIELIFPGQFTPGGEVLSLQSLNCNNNQLKSLNLGYVSVNELHIDYNNFNSIPYADNLYIVSIENNNIKGLYLDASDLLMELYCSNNEMESLTFDGLNANFTTLDCSNNLLTELDFSFETRITNLNCSNNELYSLNLKNDNNTYLGDVNTSGNSELFCIQVDDAYKANNNEPPYDKFIKDNFTIFKENSCLPDVTLTSEKESISENNEETSIVATLEYKTSNDVKIDLSFSGTASSLNYEVSSNSINILVGELSSSVTLTGKKITENSDKTVVIDLASVENADIGDPNQVTVTIIHVNDPPTDINLQFTEFEENVEFDELTKIIVDDIDDTTHDITLVEGDGSDDNDNFFVVGDMLHTNIIFDYENQKEHYIRLKAEDSGGLSIEKSFVIKVINGNELVFTGVVTNNYCDSGELGSIVTTVSGQYELPLTYQWSSGEITPDISGKPNAIYSLTVTDALGMFQTKDFTISSEPIYADMSICYITSDEVSPDNNRIYFANQNAYNIDNILILREGIVAGLYDVIGAVSPDQPSFLDTSSDNQVVSYNYKVRIQDKCGNISESSAQHKTVLLQANKAADGSINLSWNEYVGLNYGTYDIYRQENSNDYTLLTSLPSSNLSYNDTDADSITNTYSYYIGITLDEPCNFTVSNQASKSSLPPIPVIKSNIKLISSTLGVDDEELSKSVKIYPNPVADILTIESPMFQLTKVEVFSLLGATIKEIRSDFESIDMTDLSKGIYMIKIQSEYGTTVKKLIKQ